MIPVEGHANLFRDENSGAIINCDKESYDQYILSKQRRELQKRQIDDLRSELSEIKTLLKEVLKNGSI